MPLKRKPITPDELELTIANAVRETDTECEALICVFVERIVPKSRGDVNWAVRDVRYGKAIRPSTSKRKPSIITRSAVFLIVQFSTLYRSIAAIRPHRCRAYFSPTDRNNWPASGMLE